MAGIDQDQVVLKDQGSTNCTFIQGSRFKEVAIGYGAEIKIGTPQGRAVPVSVGCQPVAGRDGRVRDHDAHRTIGFVVCGVLVHGDRQVVQRHLGGVEHVAEVEVCPVALLP